MASAHAPVYKPSIARSDAYNTGTMAGLLDELRSGTQGVKRRAAVRAAPPAPAAAPAPVWSPLPEPPSCGLGPSVAELTLGRPPRAPRPDDEATIVRAWDAPAL
jgi:hypothetical protein